MPPEGRLVLPAGLREVVRLSDGECCSGSREDSRKLRGEVDGDCDNAATTQLTQVQLHVGVKLNNLIESAEFEITFLEVQKRSFT
jgi:hypothetical protein